MADYIKGLDVSQLQGVINWPAVKAAGYEFVICRCYVGNDCIDINYHTNMAGAQAAGLKVAAYNFVYPIPDDGVHANRNPIDQAKLHYQAAGDVLTCCDLEWPTSDLWSKYGVNASQICQWTLTYLATYTQLSGRKPVVYTYPNFAQTIGLASHPEFAQYKLWIASYEPTPNIPAPWTGWACWQTSGGGGKLPSSGVPVDEDVVQDLSLWDIAAASSTVPPLQPLPIPTPILPTIDVPANPIAPNPVAVESGVNIFSTIIRFLSELFR